MSPSPAHLPVYMSTLPLVGADEVVCGGEREARGKLHLPDQIHNVLVSRALVEGAAVPLLYRPAVGARVKTSGTIRSGTWFRRILFKRKEMGVA